MTARRFPPPWTIIENAESFLESTQRFRRLLFAAGR
jgi:hypothetical protein